MNSAFNNNLRETEYPDRQYNDRDYRDSEPQDREISLGTATVLGIFLALALLCALFFGLGYSMGRRTLQPAVVSTPDTSSEAPSVTASTSNKPASGSLTNTPVVKATEVPIQTPKPAAAAAELPQLSTQKPASTTTFVVQVAAVSHREDADTLITALEQRGYDVVIRQEPQDKLLHVQVGPFATRKEADAMRQHLLSDGYNAIVK